MATLVTGGEVDFHAWPPTTFCSNRARFLTSPPVSLCGLTACLLRRKKKRRSQKSSLKPGYGISEACSVLPFATTIQMTMSQDMVQRCTCFMYLSAEMPIKIYDSNKKR